MCKVSGIILWVTLCGFFFIPFFTLFFQSFSSAVPTGNIFGKLPIVILFNSISESAACGISGFLISLIVIFISEKRKIKVVVLAAVLVAIGHSVWMSVFVLIQTRSQFFKVYSLLNIILDIIFLLGFAVLGAWLFTRGNRLKMQEVKDGVP